jgi:hypothetical protein
MTPPQGRPINKKPDTALSGWHSTTGIFLNGDDSETEWSDTDVIGGNPPFWAEVKSKANWLTPTLKPWLHILPDKKVNCC